MIRDKTEKDMIRWDSVIFDLIILGFQVWHDGHDMAIGTISDGSSRKPLKPAKMPLR